MTNKKGARLGPVESTRKLFVKYKGLVRRFELLNEFELKMLSALERTIRERGFDPKTGKLL